MELTTNGRFFGLDEFAHNDKAPHGRSWSACAAGTVRELPKPCTLENLNFGFIDFYYLSHDRTSMNKHICLLLISIASVSPCLAGSSTAHGTTKQHRSGGYVQIEPRSYNTETRSFDRPWPFGPESGAQ